MRYDVLKILVVEDNPHTRMVLRDILWATGVRDIHMATDGAQALALLREQEIDIIITDLTMRPMNGVDFTRQLRQDQESANRLLPVIMVTGHATRRRVAEARDAGVNEFIVKPITARAVLDRIRRVIYNNPVFVRSGDYFGPDRRRRQDTDYPGPRRRSTDKREI